VIANQTWVKHTTITIAIVCAILFVLVGCNQYASDKVVDNTKPVPQRPVLLGKSLPAPRSVAEFVNKADAIVIGTVGPSFRKVMEGPYNASELTQDSRDVPPPQLPFTYYEIQVEEIILNDGAIAGEKPLSLRVDGHPGSLEVESGEWEMPRPGERYLLVLGRNPDDQSYGPWRGWGMLYIDGEEVRFANKTQPVVTFTDNRSPEEFLKELKNVVRAKQAGGQ